MCECKVVEHARKDHMTAGTHLIITTNFICKMCLSDKMLYNVHGDDGDYAGHAFECAACHSYIAYYDDIKCQIYWKEEYYFDNLCAIVDDNKDIRIEKYSQESVRGEILRIPYFEFKNKEHFINKVKILMVFS